MNRSEAFVVTYREAMIAFADRGLIDSGICGGAPAKPDAAKRIPGHDA